MDRSILERARTPGGEPACVLVAGASGGIGSAFCRAVAGKFPRSTLVRLARDTSTLEPLEVETIDLSYDLEDESLIAEAVSKIPDSLRVEYAFVATGWLHDQHYSPEKTYKSLDADHLLRAYQVNAVGPALLMKHLLPRMHTGKQGRIGVLSARVGSISDNRTGGWHSYRASKAALNMIVKNYALELSRKRNGPIIVGLQPGTTDTRLSAPFQRSVPPGQLQTPAYTADQLLRVMQSLRAGDSGKLFDFLGLPFDP